ncbi:MAG: RidA family protein [Pseudomonadales bacterium]|nr:RidA family protein [Pseudomonadales bacterium]MBO6563654.1 RidA family protein [Pseudomonadales bacterium]MBO6596668.1 RidA family protein [Pseudomonadales bacterium]MBO6655969.1 RidA family protein [Pseudomonadales bacterium]MBO6823343.1 RidA family protein [Pseudomonadales bacterium]
MKTIISTDQAPAAIGTYSQAVIHGDVLYVSGQIPLVPASMELVEGDISAQIAQVFDNLAGVISAAGAELDDAIKFTVYLTDLGNFPLVNEAMAERLKEPYPARAAIEVSALPKGAQVEVDAIVALG